MTVGDLIKIFRQERLDQAENYHWSDGEIVGYINDAVQEACERAKLNRDSTTDGIADIEVVAGQSLYPLHRSVFEVDSVTLDNRVLCETSIEELGSAWRTRTGQPSRFVFVPAMGGTRRRFDCSRRQRLAELRT